LTRWALVIALAGCAEAGRDVPGDGRLVDTPRGMIVDAPPDLGPRMVTLAQTTSPTVTTGNSFSCNTQSPTFYTYANTYYRVFSLADAGVTGTLHVTSVQFLVDQAKAAAGGQQAAQIKLGTYTGTLDAATLDTTKIAQIGSAGLSISDGTGTTVVSPIMVDVPAGSNLVVEIVIPDGHTAGTLFFLGSNSAGETHPGYVLAPSCGTTTPTTIASIAAANGLMPMDILVTVSGTW
jgi:hypothetical protein